MTKPAFDLLLLLLLLPLLRLQRLPLVHVLVLERLLNKGHDGTLLLLLLEYVLGAWPCARVHHVCPVLRGVSRKLFPPEKEERLVVRET